VFASGPPTVASEPTSATCPTVTET